VQIVGRRQAVQPQASAMAGLLTVLHPVWVQVGGHDDKSVDPQIVMPVAVVQPVAADETWLLTDKHRQPFNNCEGEIIKSGPFYNLVRFHSEILLELTWQGEQRRPLITPYSS
jgi:hypothetical protein